MISFFCEFKHSVNPLGVEVRIFQENHANILWLMVPLDHRQQPL